MHLWISAGELSGDQRAAELFRARPDRLADIAAFGITGPNLAAAGVESVGTIDRFSAMGLGEVMRLLPRAIRLLTRADRACRKRRPAAAILVDFGAWHMQLGQRLRRQQIPVFHLAPPKLWAWGTWRARTLQRSADAVGVLFPFEVPFYERLGLEVVHVGHPAAAHHVVRGDASRLLLLPGSRPAEVAAHLPIMLKATEKLATRAGLRRTLCLPPNVQPPQPLPGDVELRRVHGPEAFGDGAIAVAASGTVNIELAALGIPFVACYRMAETTFRVGMPLVRVRWLNPVNLSAGNLVVEELVQDAMTALNLERALSRTWERRAAISTELEHVAASLRRPDGLAACWEVLSRWL
ncbi:MAG: hypothetical protein D6761_06640 [Candidatus Dadabacteria bacterium]|nr:MAG: hypothetical protein D6761_06640 [Candidatus Dadabacteria bacterium]